ncbi:NAD-dependent epimerase/dehydratase family protein [Aliihoeflea sp. 40Bstr573]|uniref:NAD-dependent epimerase/dehydratase family protein n=1 Tax=Aliihoeflea sp. 40Bstr573 TaxID=2696467 RepID=UPI0020950767|nr:NAD-dependent epimerase/dehydratase family protein [Aliihoeflea sp. 40Bstr573]MCO6387514.1 NAD-dependent epimerase/dehydratase family protein [Aliihoeflea sp. 40Bstr573]
MIPERILVTGATGFVGRALVRGLAQHGFDFRLAVRASGAASSHPAIEVGNIDEATNWATALEGVGTVLHLAGATPGAHSETEFAAVNSHGTRRLVDQAKLSGARRFVFLSSSHAALDKAGSGYAISKRAAEDHVATFSGDGRQAISLRVPLIYGAEAKGKWRRLQQIAAMPVPLPFGRLQARRSLMGRENLVDALVHLAAMPDWRREGTFEIADEQTIDLGGIIRHLREGMGRAALLFNCPPGLVETAARLTLGQAGADRLLTGTLHDPRPFADAFGWSPSEALPDAIRRSGREFIASND